MRNSTTKRKPRKPYPDFPLFPHATGRWAKKIRGKLHYFGKWDDPQAALDRYLDQRDDLHAGRTLRPKGDGLTIRDLCNQFLTTKKHLLDTGEIVDRTFRDYRATCSQIVKTFGKNRLIDDLDGGDFERLRRALAMTRGLVALGNEIGRVRSVFKYAFDQSLIDRPIRYGQGFKKPAAKTLRKARAATGKRMFEAAEIRTMIAAASQPMTAFILLAVNAGYGQSDISGLPLEIATGALRTGWLNYPRPKTGVERRCPLWKETSCAVETAINVRPKPKDPADSSLAFITKYGGRWVKPTGDDAVAKEFAKLMASLQLRQRGRGFYALRHTFRTVADECRDQVAVNHIMGHVDQSMAGVYRERIDDSRLVAAANTVRNWLFAE